MIKIYKGLSIFALVLAAAFCGWYLAESRSQSIAPTVPLVSTSAVSSKSQAGNVDREAVRDSLSFVGQRAEGSNRLVSSSDISIENRTVGRREDFADALERLAQQIGINLGHVSERKRRDSEIFIRRGDYLGLAQLWEVDVEALSPQQVSMLRSFIADRDSSNQAIELPEETSAGEILSNESQATNPYDREVMAESLAQSGQFLVDATPEEYARFREEKTMSYIENAARSLEQTNSP